MNDQFKDDMRELKADVKELIKQGAIHNELLRTHEARSLALQEEQKAQARRLAPVEKHVDLINAIGKVALTILTGAAVYGLSRWLF